MNVKKYNKKYMREARDVARFGDYVAGYAVGAVIVDSSGYISCGWNQKKTHPKQKEWSKDEQKIHLHAEIHALVLLGYRVPIRRGAIYIWREGKSGKPLDALPCPVCAGALEYYGVDTIFHSGGEYNDVT